MDRKRRGDFAPFDRVLQMVQDMSMSVMSFDMELVERLRDPALESLRSVYRLWADIHDMIIMATALIVRDDADEEVTIISGDRQIRAQSLINCVW